MPLRDNNYDVPVLVTRLPHIDDVNGPHYQLLYAIMELLSTSFRNQEPDTSSATMLINERYFDWRLEPADFIRASGHVPRKQVGHMTAPKPICVINVNTYLAIKRAVHTWLRGQDLFKTLQ